MTLFCRKKLAGLLLWINSKHKGDFCCLNCFGCFRTKNKLESHKKVCANKEFASEFNQYQKSDKATFIIYADFEHLIKKIDGFKYIHKNLSTTKAGEHIPSGFSMSKSIII